MDADRAISGPHLARLLGAWRSAGPAYGALARAIRRLVLDGRLPLRTRLPGERDLAAALGVSRTTATAAYSALRDEGFLASRRGSGSWTRLPADTQQRGQTPSVQERSQARFLREPIDLSLAAAAAPEGALHAALAAATAELPRHLPGPGYDAAGLPVLRAAIADRYRARGVPTSPEQVLVTSGAQHALTLLLRVVAGPGDRVLTEHPSYPAAFDAIRAIGARPVPVPLLEDDWDMDMLEATLRQSAPRLGYLICDHHNPTGLSLGETGRERLVELARTHRTPLVIDETMAGLELGPGTALPPVSVHDPAGDAAIAIGSMSKAFWAGLRIGWIRASPALVARLAAARAALDISSPVVEQLVAAQLLSDADAILHDRRAQVRARRDALAAALREQLPGWRFDVPAGGLVLWVELDAPRSSALAAIADHHGVRVAPGPRFGLDGALENRLRVPYCLPEPELEEAAARLAAAWRAVTDGAAVPTAEPVLIA